MDINDTILEAVKSQKELFSDMPRGWVRIDPYPDYLWVGIDMAINELRKTQVDLGDVSAEMTKFQGSLMEMSRSLKGIMNIYGVPNER